MSHRAEQPVAVVHVRVRVLAVDDDLRVLDFVVRRAVQRGRDEAWDEQVRLGRTLLERARQRQCEPGERVLSDAG